MKKCIICGREYSPQKEVFNSFKYCSNECRGVDNRGENAYQWKGEEASYVVIHKWVQRWKGKADHCEHCKKIDRKKYEWANKDHKYKRNLEDYFQLCTSCHREYDLQFRKPKCDIEEAKRLKGLGYSYRKIARELGIGTHSTIKRYLDNN